ncbi:MAG: iron transporter [Lachnospiraceae bacterium]|nr:iron transporter [Lachnospiraceae bacterium]
MKKKTLALMTVLAMATLAACSSQTAAPAAQSSAPASSETSAQVEASVEVEEAGEEPEVGFQEYPIWEDEEVGFLNVSGVYFQPVPMSGGNENYEQYNLHFEADVSTMENDLGYGVGEWVPYMTVDFELTGKNSGEVISGTFMPMNADDGPHYGANIAMPTADTYSVKITFNSPGENGYLIHLDEETGPGGALEDYEWPLVLELEDVWEYEPVEW